MWSNKDVWTAADANPNWKRKGKVQSGYQGNGVDPTWYRAFYADFPLTTPKLPNGTYGPPCNAKSSHWWNHYVAVSVPHPNARNEAWGDLVETIRQGPASLGVAFAEADQTLGMIATNLGRCHRAYGHLRRGRFRKFLKELAIGPKRKHRNMVSNQINRASSLWLEYSFGWSPLFQDVHDGLTAMGQPLPGGRCKGKGKEDMSYAYYNGGSGYYEAGRGRCLMVADVSVVNPNLYLAQQLGLANPALIAWELAPLSFVWDWVFDVGTCLGAISDLYGCKVTHASTTYSMPKFKREDYVTPSQGGRFSVSGVQSLMLRKPGLAFPTPNVRFRSNIGQSLKRAANAASLLGQILTK